MAGQKRTRSGEPKAQSKSKSSQPQNAAVTDTPPCGQAQTAANKSTRSKSPKDDTAAASEQAKRKESRIKAGPWNTYVPSVHGPIDRTGNAAESTHEDLAERNQQSKRDYHSRKNNPNTKFKRPPLPKNATISKRPLLRPAIPTPFSSAASPKVLYITATSPFVPSCKRIRALLSQISKRDAQSAASSGRGTRRAAARAQQGLEANGRLAATQVEAAIASAAAASSSSTTQTAAAARKAQGRSVGGEEVYLKATGRAIPRALELGVKFQSEEDCRVRVEMGNVKAIDDVEVKPGEEGDGQGNAEGDKVEEEDVPETRIRTLSTVTVCIGLK